MAPPMLLLAVRGSDGIHLIQGPPKITNFDSFQRECSKYCKISAFSKDGKLFAWCNGEVINIMSTADSKLLHTFDLPKVVSLEFSPKNTILATWQTYTTGKDGVAGVPNLQLYDLKTGKCVKSFIQKKMENWSPSWSEDEKVCARSVNNEVHFFENNNFDTIVNKLHLQKVSDFELSPGDHPCKVACYVPGSKGAPSFVRLYQYPNFTGPTSALANKSFFKADRVTMLWNSKGTAVLVTASTDVDKTGASYYGEQTLHYIAANGESAAVQLPKNGPIYDVVWNKNATEFCVVYGFMPAKATVFNLKCDPIFDFGTGPRNAAFYSPQGHILVLAGFGNLRGQMEVWDVKNYKLISKPTASDATFFSWCPNGEHFITATCSPRLRVGNGYKIWHYTGSILHKYDVPDNTELWQVSWQPFAEGVFPAKPIVYQPVAGEIPAEESKPAQAYRPPALRNKPVTSYKLHEDEPPQSTKPQSTLPMSKAALKNQKKREAKKAAKQEAKVDEPVLQINQDIAPNTATSGDPETDKKIKNLKKKLKAIDQLKELQASGKLLEKNQIEKMQKEDTLLKELEDLELGV
ncbi:eukaryotic translation initiation factor 2A [Mixophyes fleayi]|uniref:eukaryotic translation initiation factor 2A n=1 Tax=Mixophyes fleayi TaxID=3061075 RepID=UPI003F4E331A